MNDINRKDVHSGRLSIPNGHKGNNELGTFTKPSVLDYYNWAGPEYSDKEKEHLKNLISISNFKAVIFILLFVVLILLAITISIKWM